MDTNPDISQSLNRLNVLVEYLRPTLSKHGFTWQADLNSYSSGGQYANGFFVHAKIKIGLIYRRDKLGSINYDGTERTLSHDEMFIAIGKEGEKRVFYNKDQFFSHALAEKDVKESLLLDLENDIIPYLENNSAQDIDSVMNAQPKWWEK